MKCVFCEIPVNEIIFEDRHFLIKYDKYPVSPGHMLIISKYHYETYFDLPNSMKTSLVNQIEKVYRHLKLVYSDVDGYNIGMNCGAVSGQTVPHFHCHVIPRYKGDVDDPTGGVRGVIPSKQKY